jgi:hypothetical protein
MKKNNSDSKYVDTIKKILKANGFRCRGNRCIPKEAGSLQMSIDFRNRWGRPIHDIGIEIKDEDAGWLLTGDLHFLFLGFKMIFEEFRPDELIAMGNLAEERIRAIFHDEIIPSAIAWTDPERFLAAVDANRFSKSGVLMPAVEKLRSKQYTKKASN